MEGNNNKERLTFLDGIRGLAALSVVVEHTLDRLTPRFLYFAHNSFSFGKFGVAAFFLTSGFVIPFSLERGRSLNRFWISRFFRLYPLYWLSIALAVSFYFLGIPHAVDPAFSGHLARNFLVNLTMMQEFARIPNAEGLYYTLAMEMAFYVFFSLLFYFNINHSSLAIAWSATIGLAVAGIAGPALLHSRVPLAGLFYFLCLFVGTSIYRRFTGECSERALAWLVGCVLASMVVEVYCNYVLVKKVDPTEHFTMWAVLLPWSFAYSVFLLFYYLRASTFPKVLIWLGAISYSVYLLHPAFSCLVASWPYRVYSFPLAIALTLTASTLTYRFVEQPFITLGKKFHLRASTRDSRTLPIEGGKLAQGAS